MDSQDVIELIQPYLDRISDAFNMLLNTMFKAAFTIMLTNDEGDANKLYSVDIDDQYMLSGNMGGLYMLMDKEAKSVLFMTYIKPPQDRANTEDTDKTVMKLVFAYLSHAVE